MVDIGTGRGHFLHWIASRYPNSRFTGVDISETAMSEAKSEAKEKGISNVTFIYGDAARLPED